MAGRSSDGGIALTPPKFRDPILARLGRFPDDWEKAHAVVR